MTISKNRLFFLSIWHILNVKVENIQYVQVQLKSNQMIGIAYKFMKCDFAKQKTKNNSSPIERESQSDMIEKLLLIFVLAFMSRMLQVM